MSKNKKKQKLTGKFCANEKGFGFITFEEEGKEDVFVPSMVLEKAERTSVKYR